VWGAEFNRFLGLIGRKNFSGIVVGILVGFAVFVVVSSFVVAGSFVVGIGIFFA